MFVKPYFTFLLLSFLKTNNCYKNKQLIWNKYYHSFSNYKNLPFFYKMKHNLIFSAFKSHINKRQLFDDKMNSYHSHIPNEVNDKDLKNKNYYEEEIDEKYYILNKKTSQKKSLSTYEPRTENQKKYVDYLNDKNNSLIVIVGSAGTGKTMYSCLKAIELLKGKKIKKVIITRPVVSVEEDIGFLPGTIESKMDPYMRPIFDIFTEFFSLTEWNDMIFNRVVEISPLAYMRGRTFKNSFIIADEMQNSSPNQMKMLLTRIGENSRMVITGDLSQSDKLEVNGLKDFIERIEKYPPLLLNETNIRIMYFNNSDIQRHKLVENVLNIYEYKSEYKTVPKNMEKTKKTNSIKKDKDLIINSINFTSSNISNVVRNYEKEKKNSDCALIPKELESTRYKDWSREIGLK